eukprot:c29121_g3_i1 orf=3-257(-)
MIQATVDNSFLAKHSILPSMKCVVIASLYVGRFLLITLCRLIATLHTYTIKEVYFFSRFSQQPVCPHFSCSMFFSFIFKCLAFSF